MSRVGRLVVRRLLWMAFSAWAVLSLTFLVFVGSPDPNLALVRFAAAFGAAMSDGDAGEAEQSAVEAYRQARGYDVPVAERYVAWMTDYATLDWGETLGGEPVAAAVADGLGVTLTYLVPALVVATVGAFGIALVVATRRGGLVDRATTALAYAGYGVPVFFAGEMLFALLVHRFDQIWLVFDQRHALYSPANLDQFLLPGVVMAVHVLVVQLVVVRTEVVEHLNEDFMRTLVASGARPRDLARHAVRNAAVPLTSAFLAELLTLLYLSVIVVEVVFGLPGFGQLTFQAIQDRDVGLILGVTIVPLLVGVAGNALQDLAASSLDPRVDRDD